MTFPDRGQDMSLVVAPLAKFSWLLARQAGCDRFKRTSEVDMWMVKLVMNIGSVMKLFAPQAQAQVKHPFNHSHTRGTCYALKRVRNARCLVVKTAIVQPEATLMESNFEAQSVRKERNILAMPDPSDGISITAELNVHLRMDCDFITRAELNAILHVSSYFSRVPSWLVVMRLLRILARRRKCQNLCLFSPLNASKKNKMRSKG